MEFIPIESIFGTLQLLLSIFIAFRLYGSMKKNPESLEVRYFFYTFVLLCFTFLFSAVSIISTISFRVDFLVSAINIIGRGLLLLSIMFFAYIPLNILKMEFWKGFLPVFILIAAFLSNMVALMSLFDYPRTPVARMGRFIIQMHRGDTYTRVGLSIIGLVAIFSLILALVNYYKIIKGKDPQDYVFRRGFLILSAGIFFLLGILFNYFITLFLPTAGRIASEILYTGGLIFFLSSILYKRKIVVPGKSI